MRMVNFERASYLDWAFIGLAVFAGAYTLRLGLIALIGQRRAVARGPGTRLDEVLKGALLLAAGLIAIAFGIVTALHGGA